MDPIRVEKTKILDLPMCYAVTFLHTDRGTLGVCASEGLGGCYAYPGDALSPARRVWENAGGTMSISQIAADGTFLAVQNFFKGFKAKEGRLVKAAPDGRGGWNVTPFMDCPYLHRFDVIRVENRAFLVTCTLCSEKSFREDWNHPGAVSIGELVDGTEPPLKMEPLIPSLTKNHGLYRGTREGRPVLLIGSMEGLYEIEIPRRADEPWNYRRLLEREISDATVVDIDGDGVEELVTIEGFHGDHVAINKLEDGVWNEVYRYPAPFAHALWGGEILGRPGLLLSYRNDNGALLLLRKSERPGRRGYSMEQFVIDELISPTNLAVDSRADRCHIHCACGKTQEMICYTLTTESSAQAGP